MSSNNNHYNRTTQLNAGSRGNMAKSNSQVIEELSALQTSTGVANIPNQIHYHHSKRKHFVNVLLFGENGLGKTGFINHVLGQPIFQDGQAASVEESDNAAVLIRHRGQEIEEAGSRALLSIVDLPNFGGKHGKKEAGKAVLSYMEDQFEAILREESQLRRQKDAQDSRIHSVIYFHNPSAHQLSKLDLELIGQMSKMANVLLVIAKGDTLLRHEYLRLKNNMREQLAEANIKVFQGSQQAHSPFEPFICVGGADLLASVPARNYAWGSLKINPSASPASLNINGLTSVLFKDFLPELILETHVKYESWKKEIIRKSGVKDEEWMEPAEVLTKIVAKISELKMNA